MHDHEWHNIVKEVHADVPALVDDFLAAFSEVGNYGESVVTDQELRLTAFEVLSMIMDVLAGASNETKLHRHAEELGRRRAQQGVPIASLVDAIQLDFNVIWARLRLAARSNPQALIEHVDELHGIVTKYNFYVRDAFRREQARAAQDMRLANVRYLERLYASESLGKIGLAEVSQVLGVAVDAPCTAVVFHPGTSIEARSQFEAHTSSGTTFGHTFRGMYAVFWVMTGPESPLEIPKAITKLPGVRFQSLRGLAQVRSAVRSASQIFRSTGPLERLEESKDLLWAVAGDALVDFVGSGVTELTAEIHRLRTSDPALIDTVTTYLGTGSIKETAAKMYCHRNTVINRLRQFSAATRQDITNPQDAALVLLSLRRNGVPPLTVKRQELPE